MHNRGCGGAQAKARQSVDNGIPEPLLPHALQWPHHENEDHPIIQETALSLCC